MADWTLVAFLVAVVALFLATAAVTGVAVLMILTLNGRRPIPTTFPPPEPPPPEGG